MITVGKDWVQTFLEIEAKDHSRLFPRTCADRPLSTRGGVGVQSKPGRVTRGELWKVPTSKQ